MENENKDTTVAVVEDKTVANPFDNMAKDATYGGAFAVDARSQDKSGALTVPPVLATGNKVGPVTYCGQKLGVTVSKTTTLKDLRATHGKDVIKKLLVERNAAIDLRFVHSRQIASLAVSDPNYRISARAAHSKKKGWTGFNISARFQAPEAAKKQSLASENAALKAKLAALGVAV